MNIIEMFIITESKDANEQNDSEPDHDAGNPTHQEYPDEGQDHGKA